MTSSSDPVVQQQTGPGGSVGPRGTETASKTTSHWTRVSLNLAQKYATVGLLIALMFIFTAASSKFLTQTNIVSLLITVTVSACVSFAAIFPLVVGEFDLSLGYMVGMLIVSGAYVGEHHFGPVWTILIMLAGGAVVGLVNGILTVSFKISSFIATLATGTILSGLTEGLSGGQVLFTGIPQILLNIGNDKFLSLNIVIWLTLALAVIVFYVLEFTPLGRHFYAIGGSERVAFLSGVSTAKLKILAFVLAGFLIGFASLFQLATSGAASPTFGPDLLLPAYAAVFLGLTTYRPGYYNVVGTVVAILVLAVGFNGLSLLGVPYWVQPLFDGAVLLVAVMMARSESRHIKVAT